MPQGTLEELNDHHYLGRLFPLTLLGAICALLLTWFMHQLIASSQQRLDESTRAHLVDFVRLKREESSASKERKPAKPTVTKAPPAPAAPDANRAESTLSVSDMQLPDGFNAGLKISGLGMSSSDGEYLPIVKVAPIYPKRAAFAGIEGSCVVEYTVTTSGSTRDVKVLEEMCTHMDFHHASVQAAKKFKYKPRIIDGEAIEVHGVTNRFIYEIAGE